MTVTGYRIFRLGWGEVEEMLFDSGGRHVAWTAAQLTSFFEHALTGVTYRVVTVTTTVEVAP